MDSRQTRYQRLENLAMDVLDALGKRDANICAAEGRIAAALYGVMVDNGLTISV